MRWLYIVFVAIFTGLVLNEFTKPLFEVLHLNNNLITELSICFGQIIWQASALFLVRKRTYLDYLGNMSTVSFVGALVLIPLVMMTNFIMPPLWIYLLYFGAVVSFMLLEHLRRCKLIGLPWTVSLSWVCYRSVVLFIILSPIMF